MLVCANCGTENAAGLKFCQECGSKLGSACAGCGAALSATAKFCGECGTPNPAFGAAAASGAQTPTATATSNAAAATKPASSGRPVPGAPVAERRLVSILFADLVGFTTLSEGRDPEETRELLSRYFDLARDVVARYGGVVEKFIGDAVMAVWGAPTAREDDAERAVRAGLELVDAVRGLGPSVQARAGVLTGEAAVTLGAVGQGMVAGDLVNTASRLQTAAAPGTVLVGDATQRVASGAIVFEPAGEHHLKGKAAPVPAWRAVRVVAERGGRNRAETLEAPFVGRDDDLRLLKDLYHATSREGRARLVSVIGPAGIGKTRLAWEFLKYVDGLEEGVWWHQGRSPAYGEGISFWALGEMIRGRCGLLETDDETTTRAKVAATVREHVPDEGERRWIEGALLALLGVGGASAASDQLFAAWRTFFERMAATGPVVMVFEDLHYADTGLLDFIDQLLEWSRSQPIYVLTLARPDLMERRPDWQAKRNFTSVYLEPLTDAAMRELLAGLVPGLPDAAVRAIVGRADGVPLYAVETVRMLLAEGKLEQREGTYVPIGDLTDLAVPETLTALIASRLDGLSADDRALVHDAAVLGLSFTLAGLSAVSGLPEAELEPRLRTLVRRELLTVEADPRSPERGQYTFVQALIREVAYNTLARKDRKTRHLAAARFFESLGSDELAGALAGHYLAAYRNAPEGAEADALATQARIALRAAAERAEALGSFEQAASFYDQALSASDDPMEQADLLERSGDAASKAAHHEVAIERLRRGLELYRGRGERAAVLRASDALGRALLNGFQQAEAIEVVSAALGEAPDLAGSEEVIALALTLARAHGTNDEPERAAELAQDALVAAEQLDAVPLIAQALIVKGAQLARIGRPVEALVLLRGGIALAEESGLTTDALNGRVGLGITVQNRSPVEAVEINRAGLADAKRGGLRGRAVYFLGNGAEASRWPGEWDWALDELATMLASDLEAPDRSWLLACETVFQAWRGTDVGDRLAELRGLYDAIGRRSLEADEFDLEGAVALAEGRIADARRYWHEVARVSDLNAPNAYPLAARAAVWARDVDGARADLAAFEATGVRGAFTQLRRRSIAASIAALEGRTSDARSLYAETRRGLLDRGIAFEAALVAIDMAVTLGGRDPDARAAAADARELLERLGARPFIERLDAALREGEADREDGSSVNGRARVEDAVEA